MPLQANPAERELFPFVVLGNKIDVDGGNSRVVRVPAGSSFLSRGVVPCSAKCICTSYMCEVYCTHTLRMLVHCRLVM